MVALGVHAGKQVPGEKAASTPQIQRACLLGPEEPDCSSVRRVGPLKLVTIPSLHRTHDDDITMRAVVQHLVVVWRSIERDQQVSRPVILRDWNDLRVGKVASVWGSQEPYKTHGQVVGSVFPIGSVTSEKVPTSSNFLQDCALGLPTRPIGADSG